MHIAWCNIFNQYATNIKDIDWSDSLWKFSEWENFQNEKIKKEIRNQRTKTEAIIRLFHRLQILRLLSKYYGESIIIFDPIIICIFNKHFLLINKCCIFLQYQKNVGNISLRQWYWLASISSGYYPLAIFFLHKPVGQLITFIFIW